MFVIYDHPYDYPNEYICREWKIGEKGELKPLEIIMREMDLEVIRVAMKRMGLVQFARSKDDDPKIVESWV